MEEMQYHVAPCGSNMAGLLGASVGGLVSFRGCELVHAAGFNPYLIIVTFVKFISRKDVKASAKPVCTDSLRRRPWG